MSHAFICEVVVTGHDMCVEYHMEYASETRPFTRTLIWDRHWTFDREYPLHNDDLQAVAVANLASIGYRAVGGEWWPCADKHPPHDTVEWYAVLERIPESTAGWRD
jgi:hypothetical protein